MWPRYWATVTIRLLAKRHFRVREDAMLHRIIMRLALAVVGLGERLAALATKLDCYGR